MSIGRFDPSRLETECITRRRTLVTTILLLIVGPATLLMADLHWRTGYDGWKVAHLVVFTILFGLLATGATQALIGFILRQKGGDRCNILDSLGPEDERAEFSAATAIVMPVCNEDVRRVIEGLRVMYESVAATGHLEKFDFFLLSDSNDPNHWIEEEAAWVALTKQLDAHGRIFFRKRRLGTNKKAGNLADFCRRWGRHYRYMMVLDADSIMTGEAIVRLVRVMERHAGIGIIQAVPRLANGETIFARMQQFASRLYGPVFSAGLNFWQLGEANYWGHNAIIRVAPFIEYCSLPSLPGDGPFAGRILSHDYVEAALMRRAGWQVWLATDLPGNFEECPANLIDFAKRDRRWMQGNLQHAGLVTARGFHPVSRIHFVLGIVSYVASPLWLAFLVISTVMVWRLSVTGHPLRPTGSFGSYLPWSFQAQAIGLVGLTIGLLFLPKILALLDLRGRPAEVRAFGGWKRIFAGTLVESVIFTFLAPILMLFHTKFFVLTLFGSRVTWGAQRRGRAGEISPGEVFTTHAGHTMLGVVWTAWVLRIDRTLAAWMSPVLASLVCSMPVSFLSGYLPFGQAVRRHGVFTTPEETNPAPEIVRLADRMARTEVRQILPALTADYGLLQAVLDPYVNAVHVALLRVKGDPPPASEERFAALREKLLRDGPGALAPRDKVSLLMDPESMVILHRELWITPAAQLAQWWTLALDHYNVIAPPPQSPLTTRGG